MGLFGNLFGNNGGNEEVCTLCGAPLPSHLIPFNGTEKLADGRICKGCAGRISPWVTGYKKFSTDQMADHLTYRLENREMLNAFTETYRLEPGHIIIAVDSHHQWIVFSRQKDYLNYNADILEWRQIAGAEIEIKENLTHRTDHTPDTHEPVQIEEYRYSFNCRVAVNSRWFRTISFTAGSSGSIELEKTEELRNAYDEITQLYRLFEQLGIACEYKDQTHFGAEAVVSGAALGMIMHAMNPAPAPVPPVQPVPEPVPPRPERIPEPVHHQPVNQGRHEQMPPHPERMPEPGMQRGPETVHHQPVNPGRHEQMPPHPERMPEPGMQRSPETVHRQPVDQGRRMQEQPVPRSERMPEQGMSRRTEPVHRQPVNQERREPVQRREMHSEREAVQNPGAERRPSGQRTGRPEQTVSTRRTEPVSSRRSNPEPDERPDAPHSMRNESERRTPSSRQENKRPGRK